MAGLFIMLNGLIKSTLAGSEKKTKLEEYHLNIKKIVAVLIVCHTCTPLMEMFDVTIYLRSTLKRCQHFKLEKNDLMLDAS